MSVMSVSVMNTGLVHSRPQWLRCCNSSYWAESQRRLWVCSSRRRTSATAAPHTLTAGGAAACVRSLQREHTSPNRITSLALDHLTDVAGAYLEAPLAALAPYFGCFGALYVGTADKHFAGSQSDLYCGARPCRASCRLCRPHHRSLPPASALLVHPPPSLWPDQRSVRTLLLLLRPSRACIPAHP